MGKKNKVENINLLTEYQYNCIEKSDRKINYLFRYKYYSNI